MAPWDAVNCAAACCTGSATEAKRRARPKSLLGILLLSENRWIFLLGFTNFRTNSVLFARKLVKK